MTLSLGLMIIGVLVFILGLMLLFNHIGSVKILAGIVIAAAGLGCVGVGYTLDQYSEVTYTVQEITPVSVSDHCDRYRVTLKAENGTEKWIYVNDNQVYSFPKGEQITMKKNQLKALSENSTGE